MSIDEKDYHLLKTLSEHIRGFASKGWCPATSTNFSVRSVISPKVLFISRSGVDKEYFVPEDFIPITREGKVLVEKPNTKVSDETEIHLEIYKMFDCNCVVHSHSAASVSASLLESYNVLFKDLELIKAFEGHDTHETTVSIPIVQNDQRVGNITHKAIPLVKKLYAPGFLIRGHGLYTWGKDIPSAKRHLEALETLFQVYLNTKDQR